MGILREYRAEFERLMNRVDWSDRILLGCFVSGLKDYIKEEVRAFEPRSLAHAISLARIQEEKWSRREVIPTTMRGTSSNSTHIGVNKGGATPTGRKEATVKRLTMLEMQDIRAKGLCYTCNEKFEPGHKCQSIQIFMLKETEDGGGRNGAHGGGRSG